MTENYYLFIEWVKKQKQEVRPFTRTQVNFVELLLKHPNELHKIGDLQYVFAIVQRFLKTYPALWHEHELKEDFSVEKISDEYEAFDWSMPMNKIEKQFPPNTYIAKVMSGEIEVEEVVAEETEEEFFHYE